MNIPQIVPAILATCEKEYQEKIEGLWDSNLFDRDFIQIDLMDGEFVKNKSVGPDVVKRYPGSFKYEIHLMVNDPLWWVDQFKGFTRAQRFIIPIELDEDRVNRFISFVRAFTDAEIGFSFNPETPLTKLEGNDDYLSVAEALLIMGVHPGFSGQRFILETVDKVKQAARLKLQNNLDLNVGVDGGVSATCAKALAQAGADYLVIGSSLLKGDVGQNLEKILTTIKA